MKLFKVLAFILALTICISILGACQKAPGEGTRATEAATTGSQAEGKKLEYTDYKLIAGKPFNGAELKFIICCADVAQFARLIERTDTEFLEKTGVKVTWDAQPWDSFQTKIMTEAVSGTGEYDLAGWMDAWGPALQKYMEPLDNYVARDGIDVSDFPQGFIESSYAGGESLIGLPFRAHFQVLYYRTDIFKKLNLEAPKTWDEVVAAAKLIEKETGKKGLSLNYGVTAQQNLMNWYTLLWGNGGDIFDENWKPIFNNDKGIAATQRYVDFLIKDQMVPKGSLAFSEADAKNEMAQGNTAMYIGWSWLNGTFLDAKAVAPEVLNNVACATIPLFSEQKSPITCTNSWPIGIFANGKNKDAAWEYIKWMTSKEIDKAVYLNGGDIVVVHNSNLLDQEVNAKTNGMQILGADILKTARTLPMTPAWAEVASVLEVAINNCASGKPVKDELDKAAKEVAAIIERSGNQ